MMILQVSRVRDFVARYLKGASGPVDAADAAALIAAEYDFGPAMGPSRRRLAGQVQRTLLDQVIAGRLTVRGTGRNARYLTPEMRDRTDAIRRRLHDAGILHRVTEGGEVVVSLSGLERLLGMFREDGGDSGG